MARTCGVLYIFTFKCASRHNAVHLFDISCFAHFDFQMCFAPQVRARFPHRNFQKWSKHGVIVHFDFQMCFAPQARALFPHCGTSQLPKVAQTWCDCAFWLPHVLGVCTFASLLWPAGSAPAALASLLIDPPQPQNIGKTLEKHCSRLSYLFARLHLLSSDFLPVWSSRFWLSPCLSFFLRGWACPSVHIVGSLASKLPSIIFSWQAQRVTRIEWNNYKTRWCEAISSALNFPFLTEVSQNCFFFDQLRHLGKFCRLASISTLSRSTVQEA